MSSNLHTSRSTGTVRKNSRRSIDLPSGCWLRFNSRRLALALERRDYLQVKLVELCTKTIHPRSDLYIHNRGAPTIATPTRVAFDLRSGRVSNWPHRHFQLGSHYLQSASVDILNSSKFSYLPPSQPILSRSNSTQPLLNSIQFNTVRLSWRPKFGIRTISVELQVLIELEPGSRVANANVRDLTQRSKATFRRFNPFNYVHLKPRRSFIPSRANKPRTSISPPLIRIPTVPIQLVFNLELRAAYSVQAFKPSLLRLDFDALVRIRIPQVPIFSFLYFFVR
ncbi:hypothetical protein DFH06DRAFT_1351649 [Mycena polygramma]|nr:hypothetical protein DFH06DRAFT_1351649 [Mycena polygramma]